MEEITFDESSSISSESDDSEGKWLVLLTYFSRTLSKSHDLHADTEVR